MSNKLQYFVIITKPKIKDKCIKTLTENGGKGVTSIYANGSVKSNILSQTFGLDSDTKRLLIYSVITTENAQRLIDVFTNEFNFNKPNTGIAFTIPIEGLMF